MKPETHVTDQISAYALNILDAADAAEVEAHLADCPACQQELRDYEELVGVLAWATPRVSPSPHLKTRLLQEVSQPSVKSTPDVLSAAAPPPSSHSQAGWWTSWRRWFQKRPLWQPALVLVLLVLLISNFQLRQQLQETSRPAGFGTVTLSDPEQDSQATGLIIISDDGLHGTFIAQNLPVIPETEAYQLWLIKDGQRTSGGVFTVNEAGYRAVWLDSEDPLASYEDFDVTLEPAGGSYYPTGKTVLDN